MLYNGQLWIAKSDNGQNICIHPDKANRHGLIAGATGTGKTITLKVMAESFSAMGVPSFVADVKGDLAGMIAPGTDSAGMQARIARFGIASWAYKRFPTRFWDVFGEGGHSVRTTISEMGPLLLARVLDLNDVQSGVLTVLFRVADENGLLLLDIKDLKAMLRFVADNAKELSLEYGNIAPQSVNAIMRAIIALEDQGGNAFFGEPAFDIRDWLTTDYDGRGMINILDCVRLFQSPTLYATFLLWLLSELYEALPEAGDLEKPRIVFFFDEAHLLFADAPKSLLQKIEQVVRLVRSKGVGVYFITQNPGDVPDSVLSQLGNRVQHALRAFSPAEQKRVRAAADTFRPNPAFKTEDAIMALGTGEALISFLMDDGSPAPVERAFILPPQSRMGGISPQEREACMAGDGVGGKYDTPLDRESAYEVLTASARKAEEARLAQEAEQERLAQEEAAAEEARKAEKAQQAALTQADDKQTALEKQTAQNRRPVTSTYASKAQRIATTATSSAARSLISSTIRRPVTKKQSIVERALNSAFNSAANGVGREVSTSIVRGLFGAFKR